MDDRRRNITHSSATRSENMSQSSNSRSSGKPAGFNKFANDGSFMDMFRKKMEEQKEQKSGSQPSSTKVSSSPTTNSSSSDISKTNSATSSTTSPEKPSILSFVGKRRGGKVLKTGAVKKVRKEEEKTTESKDAWAQYLEEVKKYKSQMCVDEDKTRPLVK